MDKKQAIKGFVQETLGCQCPEEVFEFIEDKKAYELIQGIKLRDRINIGGRLLVCIVEIDNADTFDNLIPRLLKEGKKEREKNGFNRCRIVVISNTPDINKKRADGLFKEFEGKDDRIYIHIIDKIKDTLGF